MSDHLPARPAASFVTVNDLTVAPAFAEVLRVAGLDSLDALFAIPNDDRLSKPGLAAWRERLQLTMTVEGEARTFFLKRFTRPPRSARREVRRCGCGAASVAGLEWTWMQRLAAAGVPCVRGVAMGEQLNGPIEGRSAVLTEAVPGDSLERWAASWSASDHEQVARLLAPTADLIGSLHRAGFVHRDLYLSHLFYDPSGTETPLHLIDLQRVLQPPYRLRRWIVKDLASLNYSTPAGLVSRTDRLRWLTRYLGLRKLDAPARRLVYRVVGKTRLIARHDRRRQARHRRSAQS